jgi:ankyrin repeat protein
MTEQEFLNSISQNDISKASSLISNRSVKIDTPLFFLAVMQGRLEIVSMLLNAGANVNAVNAQKKSACYLAIYYNQFAMLQLLVERGANVARRLDRPLLKDVSWRSDSRMAAFLIDAGAPIDELSRADLFDLVAMSSKSVALLERLLARGVNVGLLRDDTGNTILHRVLLNVNRDDGDSDDLTEFFSALVNVTRVNVNAANNQRATPLHTAAITRNTKAMRLLIELGADIDRQEVGGRSALCLVCSDRQAMQVSCADFLLALGADVRVITNQGQTAAHLAAQLRKSADLHACVAAGCDLDQRDNSGVTPRSICVRNGCPLPSVVEIDDARRRIAKIRLDFVRDRAFHVCVGLQPLNLDALQMCEILSQSCGLFASLIQFHQWWAIATKAKHFNDGKRIETCH